MITFRKVTPDDYQAVHRINPNVYEGWDPLASKQTFRFLVSRPYNHACVAELDGEVVGFRMLTIMDGGKTAMSRFHRTKPDLQRRGIMTNLGAFIINEVQPWNTGVTDYIFLNGCSGPTPKPHPHYDISWLGCRATLICGEVNKARLTTSSSQEIEDSTSEIRPVTDVSEKRELLSSNVIANRLYKLNRVLIDMIPYKVVPENFDMIMENENPTIMVGLENDQYMSVSFGVVFAQLHFSQAVMRINVYSSDYKKVVQHVLKQVLYALKTRDNETVIRGFIIDVDPSFTACSSERAHILKCLENTFGVVFQEQFNRFSDIHAVIGSMSLEFLRNFKPLPVEI